MTPAASFRAIVSRFAVVLAASLQLAACAAVMPRNAPPEMAAVSAEPVGFRNVRYWGDEPEPRFAEASVQRASAEIPVSRPLNFLAISGGAENGAFGAGLLVGWGEAGNRPAFDMVTGVSSGALIAPFVFLGRQHDDRLQEVFTAYERKDIFTVNIPGLLQGSALADNTPLSRLIEKYVDAAFLRDVARESSKGRVLLIGTTNLDAQRPVLWDMGRIAAVDTPEAIDLFRKVLLASATVPGAFAPVRIKVRIGDKDYDELHVDGGVTRQVFIGPSVLRLVSGRGPRRSVSGAHLYVIRNARIDPQWDSVGADVLSVTQRSLSTLIKNQGIGDIYRIYSVARFNGIDFNLASVPSDFQAKSDGPFDRNYMTALFDRGQAMGRRGYPWVKNLPGLQSNEHGITAQLPTRTMAAASR
ncbi:patatin-like phospholipase family protein [Bradyrhizobium ontarionense]|uniref:Patatin-like phospholipase family protein n=1 Tax=Bradyrhizobium ontarionense TaxID=2898149 RepID=A0ABY3RDQ9_9BRAD|nr:patatin-like phospholipase family protein [Bradyrhizobium sp. A19]UFZ05237.1 patatin-like phospholipase family protein [Bradyrhizobium sp. A19]